MKIKIAKLSKKVTEEVLYPFSGSCLSCGSTDLQCNLFTVNELAKRKQEFLTGELDKLRFYDIDHLSVFCLNCYANYCMETLESKLKREKT